MEEGREGMEEADMNHKNSDSKRKREKDTLSPK